MAALHAGARARSGPSPTSARRSGRSCAAGSTRSPGRPCARRPTRSYDDILVAHLIPGLGQHRARQADAGGGPDVPEPASSAAGLSPRRVQYIHAVLRRALVTAEKWGMVSRNVAKLVDPPRVAEARDHAAHARAGAPAHRVRRRRPSSGAVGHGARHRPAPGRAAGAALGGRRPRRRHACGSATRLANVDGRADAARAQDRPQPADGDAARTRW